MVEAFITNVFEALRTFIDEIISAILAPGTNWQLLFLGLLFGQGPFQLWEAGILNAYENLKINLAQAASQALTSTVIAKGIQSVANPRFRSKVWTLEESITWFFDYLLVQSQSLALFQSSGLATLILRLETRFGAPLRKILTIIRGEQLISLTKSVIKTIAGVAVILLKTGGYLVIILMAAQLLDDIQRNPRVIFRHALRQTKKRRSLYGDYRTRETV